MNKTEPEDIFEGPMMEFMEAMKIPGVKLALAGLTDAERKEVFKDYKMDGTKK